STVLEHRAMLHPLFAAPQSNFRALSGDSTNSPAVYIRHSWLPDFPACGGVATTTLSAVQAEIATPSLSPSEKSSAILATVFVFLGIERASVYSRYTEQRRWSPPRTRNTVCR